MAQDHVLIIDDEPQLTGLLESVLSNDGYVVQSVHSGADGQEVVEAGFDGVILLDVRLPDADGIEMIGAILGASPDIRIVMMTAHGDDKTALQATRQGAYDFLTKDAGLRNRARVAVSNAFRDRAMAQRVASLERAIGDHGLFDELVARSATMARLFDLLREVVGSRVTVMLLGESGTGKELVARAIHRGSPRRDGPFVAVNCAGIPDNLLESELFGHERGAFTGAVTTRKGKFEIASGGTLFLDEIGEMPLALQVKLLRVLETRQVERVGGVELRPLDIRVVSATNANLDQMVAAGTFRADLYYRLAVFPVELPALRERDGDVALLAHHFLRRFAKEEDKPVTGIKPETMTALENYSFPGNVRELQNIISRAVVVSTGPNLTLETLPRQVRALPRNEPLQPTPVSSSVLADAMHLLFPTREDLEPMRVVEAAMIRHAMVLHRGRISAVARSLGISRATAYRRIAELGGKEVLQGNDSQEDRSALTKQ